jgi:hypothetical protein
VHYVNTICAALRQKRARVVLALIATAAVIHLLIRTIFLFLGWRDIEKTWLSSEYGFLYGSGYLRVLDFVLRPVLLWVIFAGVFLLALPALERMRNKAQDS